MMERRGLHLVPSDPYGQQQIDALPDGKQLSVRISVMSASGKTEREGSRGMWWGTMTLLSENSDDIEFSSPRNAHDSTLFALGFVRPRFRVDGSVEMVPVSTADHAMDDGEHAILVEKARAYLTNRFGYDPFSAWTDEQTAKKANQQWDRR